MSQLFDLFDELRITSAHTMQEFPYVLSEYEEINPLLYKPINSTQRIKYTCFNASPSFIVLGSTSGSLYLFSRKPCSFIHLIPLSEGSVSCVVISPDEKTIALATTRGTVCMVALKPIPKLMAISTEHIDDKVNCLCWNDNSSEIYIGDENGKISVMAFSIFTVNGMFQTPACVLMNLDSTVVQLSFCSPFLLVSTLTRCYLCDTVQEQYKQVGNKTRNGEFGACFYKTLVMEKDRILVAHVDEKVINKKGSFNFITESSTKVQEENFPQIFCARPGSRLWEVSTNGTVLQTHQFKEALAIPPAIVYKQNIGTLMGKKQGEQTWMPQSVNFSRLFAIAEKYLFSYTSTGLYIVDPVSASVLLWNNEFSNICYAEAVENRIYLMTNNREFHCLTLLHLDSLILWLYRKRKYNECLEVCLLCKTQLTQLVTDAEANNIYNIEELQTLDNNELSTLLYPLILSLESNSKPVPQKLDSGIVVVSRGNSDLQDEKHILGTSIPYSSKEGHTLCFASDVGAHCESLTNLTNDSFNEVNNGHDKNCNMTEQVKNCEDEKEPVIRDIALSFEKNQQQRIQTDVEGVYMLIDNIVPSMEEEALEKIILDIDWRLDVIKDSYESLNHPSSFFYDVLKRAQLYYFNTLLENMCSHLLQLTDNENIIKEMLKAFVNVNAEDYTRCACGNFYPKYEVVEPKFLEIGRVLLNKLKNTNKEQCLNLCNRIPYMWQEYYLPLHKEQTHRQLDDLLLQSLQIKNNLLLSALLPLLDEKQWILLGGYAKEMQEGHCLFCGKCLKKETNELFTNWTTVMCEIIRKQGPDVAMTVLMKLEKAVSNVPIDRSIFQSLIFTKLLYQYGMECSVNFNKSNLESSKYNALCSTKIRDQLVQALEKDIRKPVNSNIFGNGPHHWGMHYQNKLATCSSCTLFLQTPILLGNNGIVIFGCGHAYHVSCMIEKSITVCNLHK